MIALEDFLEADFERFISWIKTEEEMIQFAGPVFTFPLTHQQLIAYNDRSKRHVYKVRLIETGDIIGHCEINFTNPLPRLSRILIADRSLRNKGIGKQIVKKLLDILFTTTPHTSVDLTVFDWNKNAIASYQKAGFKINPGKETQMQVSGTTWYAVNMILHKQDYLDLKASSVTAAL